MQNKRDLQDRDSMAYGSRLLRIGVCAPTQSLSSAKRSSRSACLLLQVDKLVWGQQDFLQSLATPLWSIDVGDGCPWRVYSGLRSAPPAEENFNPN